MSIQVNLEDYVLQTFLYLYPQASPETVRLIRGLGQGFAKCIDPTHQTQGQSQHENNQDPNINDNDSNSNNNSHDNINFREELNNMRQQNFQQYDQIPTDQILFQRLLQNFCR